MRDALTRLVRFLQEGEARHSRIAGDIARDDKRWVEAIGHYRAYLGKCPQNYAVWVQLGHALKESGDVGGAEVAYRRALSISDQVADTHLQLGHALKLLGRRSEAIAAYQRAFELDPSNAWARKELTELGAPLAAPTASVAATAASAGTASPDRLTAIETQLKLMSGQMRAIRVLSGEVLKTRRENERLTAQLAALDAENAQARAAIESRLAALEARSADGERAEAALSARLADYLPVVRSG